MIKLKKCSSCKLLKETSCFYKKTSSKNKIRNVCKTCVKKQNKEYYSKNSDKVKKKVSEYREDNIETIREYDRDRSKKRPPELNRYYLAKRRSAKKKATPKWLTTFDVDYIKHLYTQAVWLSYETSTRLEVDHILPLNNPKIFGLHVPWNLQIIEASLNNKKTNKFDGTNDNETWKKKIN